MTRLVPVLIALLPLPALAFEPVTDGAQFQQLVYGNQLTRLGISLEVNADGRITGRGMDRPVSGEWQWRDGYFCRSLYWGERDLGTDCQAVLREGPAPLPGAGIPPALRKLCATLMAREPDQRPTDAGAVAARSST